MAPKAEKAKKPAEKTADERSERRKALDAALAQIEKQYGKGSVMRLGENFNMQVDAIPTGSMALDAALGIGGLPRGRIIEIYGPEASGKTTLALHVVAETQKRGGEAAYIDVEHALDPVYARALGVDVDSLLVSQPDTGEQALEIMEALVRSGAVDIVVLDSVAALVPRAEIEGEMVVSKSNCLALFINQLRMKVGVMYGNPEVTSGGNALKYYASVRLDVRRTETLKNGADAIGSHTRVKVVKNKLAPPFKTAEFDVLYGIGISKDSELLDLAVKLDIIEKSGSWFAYKGERLAQGKDNVRELLRGNPTLSAEIEQQVRENIDKLMPSLRPAVAAAPAPVEIPLAQAPQVTSAAAKAEIDIVVDD